MNLVSRPSFSREFFGRCIDTPMTVRDDARPMNCAWMSTTRSQRNVLEAVSGCLHGFTGKAYRA